MENRSFETEFKSSISIEKIIEITDLGLKSAELANRKCIILVLGPTGSGKSTYSNFINGKKMIIKNIIRMEKDNEDKPRETEDDIIAVEDIELEDFEIGHSKQSHTLHIKAVQLNNSNLIICDFPGFFDNRSVEHEIANSICLKRFLENCKCVIPVVLINFNDFQSERGSSFKKLFDLIIQILKKPEKDNFNKFLFLYSHVPDKKNIRHINNHIIQEQKTLDKEDSTQKKQIDLLQNLLNQIEEHQDLLIVNPIQQTCEQHIKLIQKKVPFQEPSTEFSFSLSLIANQAISNYSKDVFSQIQSWLMIQKYENIFTLLQLFKNFVQLLVDNTHLQDTFDDITLFVKQYIEKHFNKIINELQDCVGDKNPISKILLEELVFLKEYLGIIDRRKEGLLNNFDISTQKFVISIQEISHEISLKCIENFSSNIQLVKDCLQKLQFLSQDLPEVTDIYNDCKSKLLNSCAIKFEDVKRSIDHFFNGQGQNAEKDQQCEKIESFGECLQEFFQIENFLQSFFEADSQKMNFYQLLLDHTKQKCLSQLDIIDNAISQKENAFNRLRAEANFNLQSSNKDLLDFEFGILKLLSSNLQFSQHLKVNEYYEEAKSRIKGFITQTLKYIQDIFDENSQLTSIEHLIISIDQVRNLDDSIKSSTIQEYYLLQEQLNKRILSNKENVEVIVEKYQSQFDDNDDHINEENNKVNIISQKQDFQKLAQILQFLKNMSWTDSYFKKQIVSQTIQRIEEIISSYMDDILYQCKIQVENNQFKKLNCYILMVDMLKYAKEAISDYSDRKEKSFQQISDNISEKIKTIESNFQKTYQQMGNNSYQNQWKNLNFDLILLRQINELKYIPKVKDLSQNLIQHIQNTILQYYTDNIQFISQNHTLQHINSLLKEKQLKKQVLFYQNIKFIISECSDLKNYFGSNDHIKIREEISIVYESLLQEFSDSIIKQVNPQQEKDEYEIIKSYINEFKSINFFQQRFDSFKNLDNPSKIINQKLVNIQSQIRKNEFDFIKESIKPLLTLSHPQDKDNLENIFQQLYFKIRDYINQIEYELKQYQTFIDKKFVDQIQQLLRKIDMIKEIYTEYIQQFKQTSNDQQKSIDQLFNKLNEKVAQFICKQVEYITFTAKKFKFLQMEESFFCLNQLIWNLENHKVTIPQQIMQELKKALEETITNIQSDNEIISQPEQIEELLNILKKTMATSNNQTFTALYSSVEKNISPAINKYIEQQLDCINKMIEQEVYQKSKQYHMRLLDYLDSLKKKNINYSHQFDFKCIEIEIQLQQVNHVKVKKIEDQLDQGQIDNLIEILRSQKISDKDLYSKTIACLKNHMSYLVSILSSLNIEIKEFRETFQKFQQFSVVAKQDSEIDSFYSEQLNIMFKNIAQQCEQYLNQANLALRSSKNAQNFNFVNLFKYSVFLKFLQNPHSKANKLNELHRQYNTTTTSLFLSLQDLKNKQQQFIQSGGVQPNHQDLKQCCMNLEIFIGYLQSSNINQDYIPREFIEIGGQIQSYEDILSQIKQQIKNIEDELNEAWDQEDYSKIKYIIDQLYIKRDQTKSVSSELIDLNKMIKKIEDNINKLTEQALTTIKRTKKYDSLFNALINRIYAAEENLKDVKGLQYKIQSQKGLIENEIKAKIDKIKKKCREQETDTIISVSSILIKIQRIAENVKQFNDIVQKQNATALQNYQKELGNDGIFSLAKILNETATGKYIVETYSIFKYFKIQQFNEGQLQHDQDYVFKELLSAKTGEEPKKLKKESIVILQEYQQIYQKNFDQTMQKYILKSEDSWKEISNLALSTLKSSNVSILNWKKSQKIASAKALAYICAYWSLQEGALTFQAKADKNKQAIFKKPTAIQIISIMMLLGFKNEEGLIKKYTPLKAPFKNKVIEILTGEGKSLTLGFCSVLLALIGCQVDVACYSQYLSKRDYDAFKPLFITFGVDDMIQYGTFKELSERYLKQYGDVRQLTLDTLQNPINQRRSANNLNNKLKILLIDEVDIFFDLDFYGKTYNPSTTLYSIEIEQIIRSIWQQRNNEQKSIENQIMNGQAYFQLTQQFPNLVNYLKAQIKSLCSCVKQVKQHEQQHQYDVKQDRIGYKQKDSSYSYYTQFSYHTLFAYFNKNQDCKKISDQSLKNQIGFSITCGQISYSLLPKEYTNILGVTGTLKQLNPAIKKALESYNIKSEIYAPSMYGKSNRIFLPGTMVFVECDQDNQFLKINSIALTAIQNKQAVLIFFKSSNDLTQFQKRSKLNLTTEQISLTQGMDISDIDYYVKKSTESKQITLCLREYGRGTDFICYDPEVSKSGGVVVIQAFLSEDKIEEIQIQGRTARQGKQGSYYLVLNEKDLEEEFKIKKQDIDQWKNNKISQTELYDNLSKVRDAQHNKKYESLDLEINKAQDSHKKTLSFFDDLLKGNKDKICNYINQQE